MTEMSKSVFSARAAAPVYSRGCSCGIFSQNYLGMSIIIQDNILISTSCNQDTTIHILLFCSELSRVVK